MARSRALQFPDADERPTIEVAPQSGWPRLLSRQLAATYLSVSTTEIDRLIGAGCLSIVRLPAVRHSNGAATTGRNRRVLIDRVELDDLVSKNRERHR
jgi:hypothetical protein